MAKILWVDDLRDPPPELVVDIARSFDEACRALVTENYDEVYLDHDLADFEGDLERTGKDVVMFMVLRKMDGHHVPSTYHMLTANPVGRKNMLALIERYLLEE